MRKYFLGIIAVVLAIGFSAFTAPSKEVKGKAVVDWRYNSTSSAGADLRTFSNWSQSSTSCTSGIVMPCIVQYESTTFSSYLSNLTDANALTSLNAIATSKKN